ncbi:hypothetical protein M752DRAFT_337180 [Aspergillus phoenicis ATCC 13157]|uniref:KaiA N-terminal domain-containing protein n=1 Tax=Aspergillus phoenicis ATCC 13157 TaxID=1353007 RepID=A0A370PEQ6_ASPPH|nr:hypothetical protein M752DRAFT_337180 [Aspergillus phoenicis ATCC 13157]
MPPQTRAIQHSESVGEKKRKPLRRDPEKRRQQNIQAQRRYREKLRERLGRLEALAESAGQTPAIKSTPAAGIQPSGAITASGLPNTSSSIVPKTLPLYDASDVSVPSTSVATLGNCQQLIPASAESPSALYTSDSTITPYLYSDESPSALTVWDPPSCVDPSLLVSDKPSDSLELYWTTTIDCGCTSPHFRIQTECPDLLGHNEVRVFRFGTNTTTADPYTNSLRIDRVCTIAAILDLVRHVGVTEEALCADESLSPFFRPTAVMVDEAAKRNLIRTVQETFKSLKPDLRPFQEQITIEHHPMIDILPFRTLRRNLITRQHDIDEDEFFDDMLSGLVCWGGAGIGKRDRQVSTGYASTANDSRSVQYAPAGSICETLNLYQTEPSYNGIKSWTREPVAGIVEPVRAPESGQYALLVRNIKCSSGHGRLEVDSIVVQSEHLKGVLARVMDGYPGITMSLERVEFSKPFQPFVHRWELFSEARDNESDAQAKAHIDLLYGVLATELSDIITNKQNLVLNGMITFDMLWTIFEPGQIVLSTVNDCKRAFRFETCWVDSDYEIQAVYIDYNGYEIGYRKYTLYIPAFEGTKPIMSLPMIPFMFHNDKDTLRESLTLRGKLWYQYEGHHHKHYQGLALTSYGGQEIRYKINSRVIIDTEAYLAFHSDKFSISLIDISDSPSDEDFLIATPVLRGYSLKDRKWLELCIDGVSDIVWKSRPFKSLVLPDGEAKDLKDLVLAFATSQSKKSDVSDDLLQGNGRNVIMLLHGPPGVGKTLTAECVAEVMHVPLYVQNAGALGTTAAQIKESLSFVLRMVPKWGAVLLLEEADILTQKHNPSDPQKKALSHVFLPLLEYFEGIIFLASNRVETMDPALESHIDVAIHYPELDSASRRHIWIRLLGKSDRKAFSGSELFDLEEYKLNGREIRNVLKAARVLARYQETKLGYEHVSKVLKLRYSERDE